MKKIFFILAGIIFLLMVGSSYTKKSKNIVPTKNIETISTVDDYINDIYEKIKIHWTSMDKVWPGLNYENHNFLLFVLDNDQNIEKIWLMNTKEKREISRDKAENIQVPKNFAYSKLEFEGKPSIASSISISVLDSPFSKDNILYRIITHEMVHFYYQPMSLLENEGDRGTLYPLDYKPRLYRKMLFLNLCDAFVNNDKAKYLSQAKYWFEKWKTEYPNEFKSIENTDIIEGSTRYIEYLGEGITRDMKPEELNKYLVSKTLKISKEGYSLSADSESYELGYISGILLDINLPNWKNEFYNNKKAPVDILLEKVVPIEEKMNPKIEKELIDSIEENNKKISSNIENLVKAEKDIKIPYLKINKLYLSGNFIPDGFYNYNGKEIASNVFCIYKIKNQKIELKGTSFISLKENGENYVLIPLLDNYSIKDDTLEINNKKIIGTVNVKKIVENDSRIIFLAIEN